MYRYPKRGGRRKESLGKALTLACALVGGELSTAGCNGIRSNKKARADLVVDAGPEAFQAGDSRVLRGESETRSLVCQRPFRSWVFAGRSKTSPPHRERTGSRMRLASQQCRDRTFVKLFFQGGECLGVLAR